MPLHTFPHNHIIHQSFLQTNLVHFQLHYRISRQSKLSKVLPSADPIVAFYHNHKKSHSPHHRCQIAVQKTDLKHRNERMASGGAISHANNRWAYVHRRDLSPSVSIELCTRINTTSITKFLVKGRLKSQRKHTYDMSADGGGDDRLSRVECSGMGL